MATVILTLSDTSVSGVSIHSSFKPAVGNPISPAQSQALDIIRAVEKRWGKDTGGIDIDAVHRTRDNVVHDDCYPNHMCNGRRVHLPIGEFCDTCGRDHQ